MRHLSVASLTWAYLGQSIIEFKRAGLCFQSRGTYINTADRFHQAADSLRETFLSYVFRIGLAINSLAWWLTPLSYRNGYVSKTFHYACYLKVTVDLINTWEGPDPLVLVVGKPVHRALMRNLSPESLAKVGILSGRRFPLFSSLSDWGRMMARRALFIYQEGYRVFQSRRMVQSQFSPEDETTLLISYATSTNLGQGPEFHRSYFGNLGPWLNERGYRVAVVPMILPDVRYKKALHNLRNEPLPLLLPHRLLGALDIIKAVVSSLAKPALPRHIPSLAGMDIETLVYEDITRHWISNGAPRALLVAALVRRIAAFSGSISRIIYLYENQPWERALCWEARRSLPNATLVGYQHAGIPKYLLNFYLAPGEDKEAPLPHRIVTVGKHTAELLASDGYGPNRIRVGGAIQVQSLLAKASSSMDSLSAAPEPVVLVAPSNGQEEASELVDLAAHLFDEDEGVRIIVKCHPVMPFEMIINALGFELPAHVQVSDESIDELILKSSAIVYSGSTVGVQAIALGVPAVHFRTQYDLDMDPLEQVPHLRLEAANLDELRQKIRWLLANRAEYVAEHREKWNHMVKEMYGAVTEESYLAFVS